ncbi:MAG: DegT/DnrJ/EryC1/StrS family aminotransferase [Dehalococcoidia bacterium]
MTVPFVDMQRLHGPNREELLGAFARVVDSGGFVQGREVEAFEQEFAGIYGVRHALAVSNGTTALHLALLGAGVGPGDEVITVSNTFIATVEAISMVGATPVFADIDFRTMLIDPTDVERRITARTRAIIPVHLYGRVCDMDAVMGLARRYNLKVIEDTCQAHGATDFGQLAGTFGDAGCFSFYPTKNLGTVGEGGMVITNDDDLAARVSMLRNHGQQARHVHVEPGYNYRMSELQAAALRLFLPHLATWNEHRAQVAAWYAEALEGAGLSLPDAGPAGAHVFHLYVARSQQRDSLMRDLSSAGIGAAIHYPTPIHLQPAYAGDGEGPGSLPITEHACSEIVSLPMHPAMTRAEVDEVAAAVRAFNESRQWAASAAGGGA